MEKILNTTRLRNSYIYYRDLETTTTKMNEFISLACKPSNVKYSYTNYT